MTLLIHDPAWLRCLGDPRDRGRPRGPASRTIVGPRRPVARPVAVASPEIDAGPSSATMFCFCFCFVWVSFVFEREVTLISIFFLQTSPTKGHAREPKAILISPLCNNRAAGSVIGSNFFVAAPGTRLLCPFPLLSKTNHFFTK